jgi:hypothetical protein
MIRFREEQDGWWEAGMISQFDFFDNEYPDVNFESQTMQVGSLDVGFHRWWDPFARGNATEWSVAGHAPGDWPYD